MRKRKLVTNALGKGSERWCRYRPETFLRLMRLWSCWNGLGQEEDEEVGQRFVRPTMTVVPLSSSSNPRSIQDSHISTAQPAVR
jgi:hypothetical protein